MRAVVWMLEGPRISARTFDDHPRFLGKVGSVSRKSCHPPIATGLRIGEAVAIKWSDFDGDLLQVSRRLYEGRVDAPKTRSPERGLPIPHALLSRLRALSDSEWIFRARNGAPVDLLSRLWQLQRRNRGSFEPSGRDRPREGDSERDPHAVKRVATIGTRTLDEKGLNIEWPDRRALSP